jgi:glycolate oxidase FAD binding subunit
MDTERLQQAIADAGREGRRLEIRGGGSKRAIGAPRDDAAILDTSACRGILAYDPAELVVTVGAGTPLVELEQLLADNGQMLAFEPFDHGPIFGHGTGSATIGGVIAAGVSGSRRLSAGAARDHLLGFRAISGRGEAFVGGAKVVKNVTGYDLPKVMAGSWGRLALLTELSLKVLPSPRARANLMLEGLTDAEAIGTLSRALGGDCDIAAAAHFPQGTARDEAVTLMRLEGFGPSVEARLAALAQDYGGAVVRGEEELALWEKLKTLEPLADGALLWRIVVPPSLGWRVPKGLDGFARRWLYDWGGGLIWLTAPDPEAPVRRVAESVGGHAMLVRAAPDVRTVIDTFHPETPAVAALSRRVAAGFDPTGVFASGRFAGGADAH